MSSILKALRRLEEERARKSSVAPEIATSLLRSGGRRRQSPLWIWPTVIIAVTVMAAALLWAWRPAPVANQLVLSVAPPVTIARAVTAGRGGGALIIEEVIDQRRPVLLPAVAPVVSAPASLPAKINPLPPIVKPEASTPATVNKPETAVFEGRHTPVVSAIAWQEDSSARMAVVDGLPVMTGEFVGTAQVQEILHDRILFTEGGRLFTVFIEPQ